jgi:hypothetical protein
MSHTDEVCVAIALPRRLVFNTRKESPLDQRVVQSKPTIRYRNTNMGEAVSDYPLRQAIWPLEIILKTGHS